MSLPIPAAALEDAGIVLGRRGAGKSNALMTLFEHELDAGHRSVMVDPKGDRWGVRMDPDGSPSRFDIPIFGGDHGDVAITEEMGERIGQLVAEHDMSCLIDLSLLSLGAKQTFMMGFAPTLLQRNRAPLTLFLEEVDQFANQDPRYQPPMLVHHIANFATLGRQRGIVPWVASQRPAKVNATVRSQADTFVGMKVTSPLDREAFREWFKGHGKEAAARVEEEVGRLQPGEALVWVGATEFFDRIRFPMASTYDSGRTPKHGERIDAVELPKLSNRAIVDLLAQPALDPVPADPVTAYAAGADVGAALRDRDDRIATLERELADERARGAKDYERGQTAGIAIGIQRARSAIDALRIPEIIDQIPAQGGGGPEVDEGRTEGTQAAAPTPRAKPQRQRQEPQGVTAGETARNPTAQAILDLVDRINPARVSWAQAAAMVGRKPRGGNFNAARKWLRESGRIQEDGDFIRSATEAQQGMTRRQALDLWLSVLTKPAPAMLDCFASLPDPQTKFDLATYLGIADRGGFFNGGMAQLRNNGLIVPVGGDRFQLANPLPGEASA